MARASMSRVARIRQNKKTVASLVGKGLIGAGGAGGILALIGTLGVVQPPAAYGFTYTPPFTVTRQADGTFTTSFNIDAQKPATTGTIWVKKSTGSNSNDGLTEATAVKSLSTGVTKANALGGTVDFVIEDNQRYRHSDGDSFAGTAITCNIVPRSTAGRRFVSEIDVAVPAFVATTTDASYWASTYTTQAVGSMVVDYGNLDAKSRPKPFRRAFPAANDEATIIAAMSAQMAKLILTGNTRFAGVSYIDTTNKKIYIKRLGGLAPDANITVMASLAANFNLVPAAGQARSAWLPPEMECWGSNAPLRVVSNSTGNVTVWAKGGGYGYSQTGHGYSVNGGAGNSFAVGTDVFYNTQDCLNYNGAAAGSINFHEINCRAYTSGLGTDVDGSNNSSTSHQDCRGVRVGCDYSDNPNRTVHDTFGAASWNLGLKPVANRFSGNGQPWDAMYASGFAGSSNTTLMFLDACGSPPDVSYDMEACDGGRIYYANMDISGSLNLVSGAGSSIQAYAA